MRRLAESRHTSFGRFCPGSCLQSYSQPGRPIPDHVNRIELPPVGFLSPARLKGLRGICLRVFGCPFRGSVSLLETIP